MARPPADNVDVSKLTPQQKRLRTMRARRARAKLTGRGTSAAAGGANSTAGKGKPRRGSKYKAKGQHIDGHWLASKAEATRYLQLKELEQQGVIDELELQPAYDIVVNNIRVCKYLADFRYSVLDERGSVLRKVVEDVKGMMTSMYRLKKKLVHASYSFEIVEIPAREVDKWAGRIPGGIT